jgi:hypothetical protein
MNGCLLSKMVTFVAMNVSLLEQSDIVVTNPPFSLFREYVKQLFDYNKKFLIIGNINCITYKEIFQKIKNDNMAWQWNGKMDFWIYCT